MAEPALKDATLRHAVMLERVASGQAGKFAAFLREMDKSLREILTRGGLTAFQRDRTEALLSEVEVVLAAILARFADELDADLREIADSEARFAAALLGTAGIEAAIPTFGKVWDAVNVNPLAAGNGRLLAGFIAKFTSAEVEAVTGAIRLGIAQGQTVPQMVTTLRGTKARGYADGLLAVTKRHAEAVVRTSVAHVGAQSRDAVYRENEDIFSGYQWDATMDQRVCIQCQAMDRRVFKSREAVINPLHVNCLPGDALVLARSGIAGVSKRWFDGEMVVIRTSSGRVLACTPNHPVLTDGGWVAAQSVNLCDNVISDGGSEWAAGIDGDDKDVPARIHEIAESFFSRSDVRSVPVPMSAPDFHGDGMDGDVAVVGAYRPLRNGGNATGAEHIQQRDLVAGGPILTGGVRSSAFGLLGLALLSATRRFVGGCHKTLALLRGGACHSGELLLSLVPRRDSGVSEGSKKNLASGADSLGNPGNTNAGIEQAQSFGQVEWPASDRLCAVCMESPVKRSPSDSELAAKIIRGDSGFVFADEVVHVSRRKFSGHVYNIETVEGWYSAGGIVTHNCRCAVIPVLSDEFAFLTKGEQRSSVNGPVGGGQSYYAWLKKQPAEFQDVALGKSRAKLLRDGGLSAKRFSELQLDRRFEQLTLREMRKLDPLAFQRAGL